MKFVALVSGGKDSVFSIAKCLAHGHELVALANLYPPPEGPEELDSFMFQSAGAAAIECLAECMGVPLVRAPMSGHSGHQGLHYTPTEGDEVEDLHALVARVQCQFPDLQAVASGAVLSTYQRTRVESVCERLGLQSLAFLWRYDQTQLLREMVEYGLEAVLVKVSSQGLSPHKHLGKSIAELRPLFARLHAQHGFHVAGEGGEYETLTLNAPFFRKRLVLDEAEVVIHADDVYTPVGLLHIYRCHTEAKEGGEDRGKEGVRKLDSCLTPPAGGQRLHHLLAQGHANEEKSTIADRNVNARRRSAPRRIRPLPHIWRQGKQLNVSGVCVPTPQPQQSQSISPHQRAADQMRLCLESLQAGLALHGLTLRDVVFVHLYLRSMSSFAAINAVYCQMPFHASHPPSRSCVELPFLQSFDKEDERGGEGGGEGGGGGGGEIDVLLDCMALAGSGATMDTGRFQTRQVLHVKSLSGWAPLCIGPYSQANMLAHGHLALLAGSIGLAPSTMTLVTPPSLEASQALCNCAAILHALRSSLRTAVMVVVYVNVGKEGGREGGTGWSSAEVAEWKAMCRLDAGFQKVDKGEDDSKKGSSVTSSDYSSSDSDGDDDEEKFLQTFPAPVFLPVGVPGLPRGAAIEFEVMALSTAFAREQKPIPITERGRPMLVTMEEEGGSCPFPLPFQPAATYHKFGDEISSSSSPLSYAWEALHLPYAFSVLSLSLFIDDDQEFEEQETGVAASSSSFSSFILDYSHVALTLVRQMEKALEVANLTWRQLSHLRLFYAVDQLDNEQLLREALAAALPEEGQCARTFLPVSCLAATDEEVEGNTLLFRMQALALDLERLRTEAWVHEVPDGGI